MALRALGLEDRRDVSSCRYWLAAVCAEHVDFGAGHRDVHLHVRPAAVIAEVAGRFAGSIVDDGHAAVYSPGSLNVAVAVGLAVDERLLAAANVTLPGPRYFAHSTVMPDGVFGRGALGRPSSVRRDVQVASLVDRRRRRAAACTCTTGGVFELMCSLLPPRVVRRRSICHTRFSVPAIDFGLAADGHRPHELVRFAEIFRHDYSEHVLVAPGVEVCRLPAIERLARTCCRDRSACRVASSKLRFMYPNHML